MGEVIIELLEPVDVDVQVFTTQSIGDNSFSSAELSELIDVSSAVPTDGQALLYDEDTELWTPETIETGGGTAATTTFTPAGNITSNNVQLAIEELDNDLNDVVNLENIIIASTIAAMPAAGQAGRLLLVTNENGGQLYRDNGTIWVAAAAPVTIPSAPGGWTVIQDVLLSSTATSIPFTSIPSGYRSLRLHLKLRTDGLSTGIEPVLISFNSDTTDANYDRVITQGSSAGSTTASVMGLAGSRGLGNYPRGGTSANSFCSMTVDIVAYSDSNNNKTALTHNAVPRNRATGGAYIEMVQSSWFNTAPITSITLTPTTPNFIAGCRATLYGVV